MKGNLFYIGLSVLLFFSCGSENDYDISSSYIETYLYEIRDAECLPAGNDPQSSFYLNLIGDMASIKGNNSQMHGKLANKYNDISWGGSSNKMYRNPILSDTITHMHITCLQKFNERYLENAIVDDLFEIELVSVEKYIKSGYKDQKDYEIVTEPLKSFNETHKVLFENQIKIRLLEQPILRGKYDFSIRGFNKDKEIFSTNYQLINK